MANRKVRKNGKGPVKKGSPNDPRGRTTKSKGSMKKVY